MKATIKEILLISNDHLINDIVIVNGYDAKGTERTWHIEAYKLAKALDAIRRYQAKKNKIEVKEG
jgi:hypothetical protein